MKVYVATKFEDKRFASFWMGLLRAAGIEITHDWSAAEQDSDAQATDEERTEHAMLDFQGVLDADLVWILAPKASGSGCWTEMGIALGRNIPVVLSGAVGRNIFDEFTTNFPDHLAAFLHILSLLDRSTIRDYVEVPCPPSLPTH